MSGKAIPRVEKKGPVVAYQAQCGQEGEACEKHLLAVIVFGCRM